MTEQKEQDSKKILNIALEALDDLRAENVSTMLVEHITDMMEYIVIATATSRQHAVSLGKHLKEQKQLPDNLLIGTVMANLGFELAWQKLGGKLIRTAVGDQNVQASMWETGAMLGGEQSGHILCHHHHFSGDGIQTALQLTALVRQQGKSLASLVDNSFKPYPQVLTNVRVEDRNKRVNWQQSKNQRCIYLF